SRGLGDVYKRQAIPGMVFASGILSEGGVFVLEHGAKNDFSSDAHFIERREYGSVNFSIFKG
ncbi:MAG TPA: 16S rRNA (guanine(966)-N(2))-methyltransferase RsmD, partial [Candidatus Prevotella intestinigallinarum]|nr:16S rRNA (guanine(966)-N(2))-methyltransferase RsmD [Candidatus Prevotella intestinigallinarum]